MYNIDKSMMQLTDIQHSLRVANYSVAVCNAINLDTKKTQEILISSILHDIGKSMIDKSILNKKTKLTPLEWRAIKHHAEIGGIIAFKMNLDKEIIKNIVYHHENHDGSGYPRQLKGNEIILGAQIIRICDTYDALRMVRPYKNSYSHYEALKEIRREKYKYNPTILKVFMGLDFSNIKGLINEKCVFEREELG